MVQVLPGVRAHVCLAVAADLLQTLIQAVRVQIQVMFVVKLKIMLKFFQFYILMTGLLFCVASPISVAAETRSLEQQIANQAGYTTQGVNEYTLSETIGRVIKVALGFVGTLFFVLMVYAGYLWITAQGNSEQVDKAKEILKTAVIGIIIVVAAYSITAFILIFTAQSTSTGSPTG